jgi:hypothetical protein
MSRILSLLGNVIGASREFDQLRRNRRPAAAQILTDGRPNLGQITAAGAEGFHRPYRCGGVDAHKAWGKDLEPYVVSGSARWEVFRVV